MFIGLHINGNLVFFNADMIKGFSDYQIMMVDAENSIQVDETVEQIIAVFERIGKMMMENEKGGELGE